MTKLVVIFFIGDDFKHVQDDVINPGVMWVIQLRLLLRSVIHDKWLGKECVSIKKWKAKLKGTFLSAYFIFAMYMVFRQ